jgi:hypothetical protein
MGAIPAVVRATLISLGWHPDEPEHLSASDHAVIAMSVASLYAGSIPTGEGEISERQRVAMRTMGVL